jgi:hypothetical protein
MALAFASVVTMRSCSMRDMHIFFIMAWKCDDVRLKCEKEMRFRIVSKLARA